MRAAASRIIDDDPETFIKPFIVSFSIDKGPFAKRPISVK